MATWHTDNILGNDTTGDGSAALPYKTLTKAFTVATSGDTFKVAGSTLSDVGGGLTLTFAWGGTANQATANIDPTGLIAIGDVISIVHPTWGADKFFYRVTNITGTTVVLNMNLPVGTFSIRKFNQIHYATTTASTTFESGTPPANAQILGGWDSTFTTQNGWTVARYQVGVATSVSGVFMSGASSGTTTLKERFAFISLTTGFAGTAAKETYGDMIASRTTNINGGSGVVTKDANVKWYILGSGVQSGATFPNPVDYDLDYGFTLGELWTSRDSSVITVANASNWQINTMYAFIPNDSVNATTSSITPPRNGGLLKDVYLDAPVVALNTTPEIKIGTGAPSEWRGSLNFINGPVILQAGVTDQITVWNNPTQNTDIFQYHVNQNNARYFVNRANVYINDISGIPKLLSNYGYVYADSSTYVTGSNSLKIKRNYANSVGQYGLQPIGQFTISPTATSVTINVTAKIDIPVGQPNPTETFQILPVSMPLALGVDKNITLTSSWATYNINLSAAEIELFKGQLCTLTWKDFTNSSGNYEWLWIDDVTLTQS